MTAEQLPGHVTCGYTLSTIHLLKVHARCAVLTLGREVLLREETRLEQELAFLQSLWSRSL